MLIIGVIIKMGQQEFYNLEPICGSDLDLLKDLKDVSFIFNA